MAEYGNICSLLLGLNKVSNLSHIKAHCYIAKSKQALASQVYWLE